MGVSVPTYEAFRADFRKRRKTYDLFGFILFDERPTHKKVQTFCEQNFEWLDGLARAHRMVLYVPIAEIPDQKKTFQNCSLKIAGEFGIAPNILPAILFFSLENGTVCVKHSSYLRFRAAAFDGEAESGQALIADVFSAVDQARRAPGEEELIVKLKAGIERIKRQENLRPIKAWAKEYVIRIANLPLDVLQSMAQAFGARLAGGA